MKLHFIRHAQAQGNENRCFLGVTDHPLTNAGEAHCGQMRAPDAQMVFVSPMRRCVQTAQILYPAVETVIIPPLKEYDFGIFEGKSHIQLKHDPAYLAWLASAGRSAPPGGEDWQAFCTRCQLAVAKIITDCLKSGLREAAVMTHGGVIMAALSAFGSPPRAFYEWQTENLDGWTVCFQPLQWAQSKTGAAAPLEKGAWHV